MTSAVWKYESDAMFAANRFPARGVARRLNEGSGSWIVAYATEQHNKLKTSLRQEHPVHLENEDVMSFSAADLQGSAVETPAVKVLDAKFMMWHHQVSSAADLCSLNVPDRGLEDVREEDFTLFRNVAYVNAAENILPFRPFNSFPNIRELELPLNGLRNLTVQHGDFPNLQVLDLSYNNLSSQDVLALGVLPKLKALTLTGNGLTSIHPDMARPILVPNDTGSADVLVRFKNLEVLLLDDNRLSDLSTFASLAALTELRELNLDKNGIEVVPHLKVIGNRVISDTHSMGKPVSTQPSRESRNSSKTLKLDPRQSAMTNAENTPTEHGNSVDQLLTPDVLPDGSPQNPPFQNLRLLSLANNHITEEEYILAVAAWPALTHLVLYGNPIVKNTNGQPPLISHYLNKRLGINVHRFKPQKPIHKPSAIIPNVKSRKVTSVVPKIPKQNVDDLIYSFKEHLMAPQPHPPISAPPKVSEGIEEDHAPKEATQNIPEMEESVFLTQVDELPEEDVKLPEIKPVKTNKKAKKNTEVQPSVKEMRFKGYEELLNAKDDPSLHEPAGIQGNIRVLNHLLSHPTVFRSSEVTLDRILPSYNAKTSKHTAALQVARNRHRKTKPSSNEQFMSALDDLKARKETVIELPLTQAMNQDSYDVPYEEADQLLREVEDKYRVVREQSLEVSKLAQRTMIDAKAKINKLF